ncbi:helix-turn-helix transcriptional regulator [Sphingobium yanoikuyae]|uniref:helix-turn-helix transcriptional regulator n=1 Tax=Sphingobium yanoikuyae TaxID=13690 RepID=UPI0022DE6F91|nr:AraC family transcriptional regulator [Sphingobium yanoikuyae]WBQ16754.1 AraC family transcriptional regulator [Sphingobium yanoikuyae]
MDKHFVNGAFVADELVRDAVHQALATIEPLQKQRQQMTGTFEGWFWVEDVAPHLFASACELACPSGAAISQPVERSVMISLLLKGENGQFVPEGAEPVSSHVERAHIVALGEPRLCSRVLAPGQGCRRVELGLRAPFLDVNADALSTMDLEVLDYLMRPGFRSYHLPRTQTITHMASMLAEEHYHGSLGRLFRESMTVQLILQSLRLFAQERTYNGGVKSRGRDAVMAARDILDEMLLAPPGTIELARRVGLNRNALQAGFRDAFGTTVFGYVRDRRMAMARVMIEEQGLGAAEAGYKVGFASPSAFTAAYRRTFGSSPIRGQRAA